MKEEIKLIKRIVFIVNDFYPKPSANGVCIGNIIELLKEEYEIIVICQKGTAEQNNTEFLNGIQVERITTRERGLRFNKNTIYIAKIRKLAKDIFSKASVDRELKKEIFNRLVSLNKIKKIDLIIPVCFPFESVIASFEFRKKYNIPYIPFLFDKFSLSNTRHRNKINKKLKFANNYRLEKNCFNAAAKVIATKDWNEYFDKENFSVSFVQVPSLKLLETNNTNIKANYPRNLLFVGSVSKKMRPIDQVADLLVYYSKKYSDTVFSFYGNQSGTKRLKNAARKYPDRIQLFSPINKIEITEKYINSDILVSIGNIDISQTPSKIFEYIGTGKPIIHFYRDNSDPIINVLKKYGNALVINQFGNKLDNSDLIHRFIDTGFGFESISWTYFSRDC
ncbi:hypothetical protein [Enterococcus dongliensis]|uniref:hypothetical protein n=1 Tax=Enterococcus dongliensis TaxID=2559925 RepID=UPI0028912A60|nr:hypothetical protein [Enterococcus dongliensis]MDT2712546.1 hypothetical protein [Enterococcus dongliensis]